MCPPPSIHVRSAACLLSRKYHRGHLKLLESRYVGQPGVLLGTRGPPRHSAAWLHEGFFQCHVLPVGAAPPLATQVEVDMLSAPGL